MTDRIFRRGQFLSIGDGKKITPASGCDVVTVGPALHALGDYYISARSAAGGYADIRVTLDELEAFAEWALKLTQRDRMANIAVACIEGCARVAKEQAESNQAKG